MNHPQKYLFIERLIGRARTLRVLDVFDSSIGSFNHPNHLTLESSIILNSNLHYTQQFQSYETYFQSLVIAGIVELCPQSPSYFRCAKRFLVLSRVILSYVHSTFLNPSVLAVCTYNLMGSAL